MIATTPPSLAAENEEEKAILRAVDALRLSVFDSVIADSLEKVPSGDEMDMKRARERAMLPRAAVMRLGLDMIGKYLLLLTDTDLASDKASTLCLWAIAELAVAPPLLESLLPRGENRNASFSSPDTEVAAPLKMEPKHGIEEDDASPAGPDHHLNAMPSATTHHASAVPMLEVADLAADLLLACLLARPRFLLKVRIVLLAMAGKDDARTTRLSGAPIVDPRRRAAIIQRLAEGLVALVTPLDHAFTLPRSPVTSPQRSKASQSPMFPSPSSPPAPAAEHGEKDDDAAQARPLHGSPRPPPPAADKSARSPRHQHHRPRSAAPERTPTGVSLDLHCADTVASDLVAAEVEGDWADPLRSFARLWLTRQRRPTSSINHVR